MVDRHSFTIIATLFSMLGGLFLLYDLLGQRRGLLRRALTGIIGGAFTLLLSLVWLNPYGVVDLRNPYRTIAIPGILYVGEFGFGFVIGFLMKPLPGASELLPITWARKWWFWRALIKQTMLHTRLWLGMQPPEANRILVLWPVLLFLFGTADAFQVFSSLPGLYDMNMHLLQLTLITLLLGITAIVLIVFFVALMTVGIFFWRFLLPIAVAWAQNLPKRTLGYIGTVLMFAGFGIQLALAWSG